MNNSKDTESAVVQTSVPTRRRFLGAGGAVTVLASLKSGSALAEGVCASPSSFSSIRANPATSRRPNEPLATCHSHGYWKNKPWPIPKTTTVADVGFFPSTVSSIGISGSTKLVDIINVGGDGGERAFAADLVSAYLDARSGAPIAVGDVLAMWSVVFGVGSFTPGGSSPWTKSDVRGYLDVLIGKVQL